MSRHGRVGDLVCLESSGEYGVITSIDEDGFSRIEVLAPSGKTILLNPLCTTGIFRIVERAKRWFGRAA